MALSPHQWLDRLAEAMDDRSRRIATLRSYMDGDAPLPEGAEGCRDAYKEFQRKARTNFGELIVEAVTERMIPSGFMLDDGAEDDDALRAIWKRNHLKVGFSDVKRDMIGLSAGYMMVGETGARKALVTCERPEQVITEQGSSRPDDVRASLKAYRDTADGFDVALLHLPGRKFTFYRDIRESALNGSRAPMRVSGGWTFAGVEDTGLDFVPVFPFLNRGGLGEFESHTDVLDRINWNILQRLVITAMQAYRQRALKSPPGGLPTEDENGDEIDYGEMFKPGAGSLWELPEGVDLWESGTTDFTPILSATKDDLTHLGAVTRTPMPMLIPDGANQTAEGAAAAREGLVFKTQDRVNRADAALTLAMGAALAIERGERVPVEGVEVSWEPLERRSLQERADAATKAQDIPWRDRMTDIWGYSADRVDNMESNRAADALNASLSLAPQFQAPVNGDEQQA